MTGTEIRTAYANHLPIVYHYTDGCTKHDILYDDIFSISYVIREDINNKGERYRIISPLLTLNDTCGHSQSTVLAKNCDLKHPESIADCDYTPDVKLPEDLWDAFKRQKPVRAEINGETLVFPCIRKLEMFLLSDCSILIMCTVGERFNIHKIPACDISFI